MRIFQIWNWDGNQNQDPIFGGPFPLGCDKLFLGGTTRMHGTVTAAVRI